MDAWIGRVLRGIKAVVLPNRAEGELDEEISFHLEMLYQQYRKNGMSERDAWKAAKRSFGGEEQVKETIRSRRSLRWLEDVVRDVSLTFRQMARRPGFALAVVVTLAVGIGANTAVFSVVNSVLLQPLPNDGGDRLVRLSQHAPGLNQNNIGFSVGEIRDFQAQFQSLDHVVEFHQMTFNLIGEGEPEEVQTGVVSWDYFDAMGMNPVLGRGFTQDEEAGVGDAVLVFSHEYWMDRFGGDPGLLGREFEMNDRIHTVVGILPPAARFPAGVDVYMPVSHCPIRSNPDFIQNRNARMMTVVGRMADGATLEDVHAEAAVVASALAAEMPDVYRLDQSGYTAGATLLKEELVRDARPVLLILLTTTAFVLLIACANVANLLLARLSRRNQELAVRSALGARRGRLIRQLLTESVVLSLISGTVGLGLAWLGTDVLVVLAENFTPRSVEVGIDVWVLAFTMVIALGTGVVFGVLPALLPGQSAAGTIRAGSVGTGTRRGQMAQSALLSVQVAASFMLLVGAGLLMRSFVNLQAVDPGYQSENVLTARVAYPIQGRYMDPVLREQLWLDIIREVEALPRVAQAGVGNLVPLTGGFAFGNQYQIVGKPRDFDNNIQGFRRTVTDNYFSVLGIPLLQGRLFGLEDVAEAPSVAISNKTFADEYFEGEDPIGQTLVNCNLNGCQEESAAMIVGVVGDVRFRGLELEAGPEVYNVARQSFYGATLALRSQGDPRPLQRAVTDIIHRFDPELPVVDVMTLEEVRSTSTAPRRLTMNLMGVFAAAALVVTLTGIFGLMAYIVGQRRRELAIRMAFGAGERNVVAIILRRAGIMVGVGLVVGAVLSPFLNRAMAGWLWGVESTDLGTFIGVAIVLAGAAFLACYLPARRAAHVSPLLSLKSE